MIYSLEPSSDGKYLIVCVKGNLKIDQAWKVTLAAQNLARSFRIDCLLFDLVESRYVDTDSNAYAFACKGLDYSLVVNKHICVVLLIGPQDNSYEYLGTVLQGVGFDVTLVRDRDLAISHFTRHRSIYLVGKEDNS